MADALFLVLCQSLIFGLCERALALDGPAIAGGRAIYPAPVPLPAPGAVFSGWHHSWRLALFAVASAIRLPSRTRIFRFDGALGRLAGGMYCRNGSRNVSPGVF